jgi:hypothetical protein
VEIISYFENKIKVKKGSCLILFLGFSEKQSIYTEGGIFVLKFIEIKNIFLEKIFRINDLLA